MSDADYHKLTDLDITVDILIEEHGAIEVLRSLSDSLGEPVELKDVIRRLQTIWEVT